MLRRGGVEDGGEQAGETLLQFFCAQSARTGPSCDAGLDQSRLAQRVQVVRNGRGVDRDLKGCAGRFVDPVQCPHDRQPYRVGQRGKHGGHLDVLKVWLR